MQIKITALPGDGIGPEVTAEAGKALEATAKKFGHELKVSYEMIGGAAIHELDNPLPAKPLHACFASGAVLLGAVGDPAFDNHPVGARPETGLLKLRRELGAFANLR